jgi:predicted transcriptional regulator
MEKTNDGAAARKSRLEQLVQIIGNSVNGEETRIRSTFMLQTGLSKTKAAEYLETLIDSGVVIRDGGCLKVKPI